MAFKLRVDTKTDIMRFSNAIDAVEDEYIIVDGTGKHRVSAKSLIGRMYAFTEFEELYLINETRPDYYPATIEEFRA